MASRESKRSVVAIAAEEAARRVAWTEWIVAWEAEYGELTADEIRSASRELGLLEAGPAKL